MSCEACEETTGERVAWYRWKKANIGLIGCDEHLREIMDKLNEAQKMVSK